MELLYFTDISQVQYVLDKKPHLFEQMMPITGDIVVAFELERLKIDYIDEWDFLSSESIQRNWNIANDLSTRWWEEIDINVYYEGFSLFEATKQDMVYPIQACLNAKIVYERLITENHIERISGFFLPPMGVVRTGPIPTHRAVRSVSQAVLFWLANKSNIPIETLFSTYDLSHGRMKQKNSLIDYKNLEIIERNGTPVKIALVKFDTMTGDEYSAIKDSINGLSDWMVIPLSNEILERSIRFNQENSDVQVKLQKAWKEYDDSILNYKGIYPEIFANKYLSFQFKRIWEEMNNAIISGDLFSTFLKIFNPSMIFFGHEVFTRERVFVNLAKKVNISSIGILHGGLGHKFGYRGIVGDSDSILVWNDIDIINLTSFGIPDFKLKKIGCIRYEKKYVSYIQRFPYVMSKFTNKATELNNVKKNSPTILILTAAINSGFSGPVSDPRKHRETLNELLLIISSRRDLRFIIKAHPGYDYYEIYRRMNDIHLPNLHFWEGVTLDEALKVSDVCVMINYFTTAALEAMLGFIPVIYLSEAVYPLSEWEVIVPEFNINKISAITALEDKIDQLLNDNGSIEDTFIEANKIINKVLDVNDLQASSRLLALIKNTIAEEKIKHRSWLETVRRICSHSASDGIIKEEMASFENEILKNHSIENVLFTLSYLAGLYNLGISSIYRIQGVLQKNFVTIKSNEIWWNMLDSYISGYDSNTNLNDKLSAIKLFGRLLICPKKFISLPSSHKSRIFKYLFKSFLGRNFFIQIMWNAIVFLKNKITYNITVK